MAATVFPAPSASQLTDQGGQVVLARFKSGDVAITSAQLPVGTYYLTTQGAGDLDIFPYANGQLGARIRRVQVAGSTTVQISIPAGSAGLAFSGSYDGPLVFQTIASASSVIFGATQVQVDVSYLDFTNYDWKPIPNSPLFITWNVGYSTIVNINTGAAVTTALGGTRPVRSNDLGFITANNFTTLYGYNPSTGTICFANGYSGGTRDSYIYRSTNQGLTWSLVVSNVPNDYGYWNNCQFEGSNFYVTAGWTGTSQGLRKIYVSSNDGATWSFIDLTNQYFNSANTPLSRIVYSPTANRYIALPLPNSNTTASGYDTVWNLGSSGTSYVDRVQVTVPGGNGWTQGGYIPANDQHSGRFILISDQGHSRRSDDGLTWVTDTSTAFGSSFVNRFNEGYEGYVQSFIGIATNGSPTTIRFAALRNDQSNGFRDVLLYDGNGSRGQVNYWISPYSSGNSPTRVSQISNDPTTSARRAVVALPGDSTRFHRITTEAYQSALISPSGFAGTYHTDSSSRNYYSSRYDLAIIPAQNGNLFSNASVKPRIIPSDQIWSNTNSKDIIETSGGTIFVLAANGETLRTTNGTNWSNGPTLTMTHTGTGQHLGCIGNTILVSRGASSQVHVSLDQGASFFTTTMPSTGNASDTAWRITSNGTFFLAIANASGQVWRSTDGMSWTNTGGSSGGFSAFPWRAGDICFGAASSGNTTLGRFTPGGSTVVTYTNPNSSFENAIVQFGSEYAMLPYYLSNNQTTFYTSSNGSTWTARSILDSRFWNGGMGSPSFAVAFSGAASVATKVISTRTVTVS